MDAKEFILRCDAALSIWEQMLMENEHGADSGATPMMGLNPCWEAYGTAVMRKTAIDLSQWVEDVWSALQKEQPAGVDWDICFDWDFVPRILKYVAWVPRESGSGDVEVTRPPVDEAVRMYKKDNPET